MQEYRIPYVKVRRTKKRNRRVDEMSQYCFGVDVGGTSVKMGLFTTEGTVIDKWEIPTRTENGGSAIVPDIADAIKEKLTKKQMDQSEVIGVGIGVPGPVDANGIVHKAVNLDWDQDVDLEGELSGLTGLKVKVGNDANVAALGEMWKGGGQGYKDMVLVTLGTGVGGGIIVNGRMLVGYLGAGGEIGHIHIEDGEPDACGCGNHGCFEQYASATGVVRLASRALLNSDQESVLRNSAITAKTVFDAAKDGDALALEIIDEYGRYLGKGLSIISGICNPEAFVIGGGVSKAGEILFHVSEKYYQEYVFHAGRKVQFKLATLGNDAGIYGSAKLILEG